MNKRQRRIWILAVWIAMLSCAAVLAYVAALQAAPIASVLAVSAAGLPAETETEDAPAPGRISLYPSQVLYSDDGREIRKVYTLKRDESPALIPQEDIALDDATYTLIDILRTSEAETDSKPWTETVTFESDTDDVDVILPSISETIDIQTPDGYAGELPADLRSIQVTANYVNSTKRSSVTRTYPSLADAEAAGIPKEINENGRVLTLENLTWREDNTMNVDDYAIGDRYTAVAVYSGVSTSRQVKNYTVSVDFTGEVSRTTGSFDVYEAVYRLKSAAAADDESEAPPETARRGVFGKILPFVLAGLLLAAGIVGLLVWKSGRERKEVYDGSMRRTQMEPAVYSAAAPQKNAGGAGGSRKSAAGQSPARRRQSAKETAAPAEPAVPPDPPAASEPSFPGVGD
jgi:hypothetical protein